MDALEIQSLPIIQRSQYINSKIDKSKLAYVFGINIFLIYMGGTTER